ncbi:MAG TPA: flagellar basal body-associated FliL family protein [Steroidobacteraceae bacterium]|nr:flagellar basal body-associated FliL family protein [Steroidobacteraceae bacterium]
MSSDVKKSADPRKGAAAAPVEVAPKSNKKLFIIIGAAIVVIGGGAGGFFAMRSGKAADKTKAAAAAAPAAPVKAAPLYYKFDPPFVVNFGEGDNSRYLQIAVEAMTRDPKVSEGLKENEPAIRNDLLLLYSAQKYDGLVSAEGKEALRSQTLDVIRKTLAAENYDPKLVEGAYFTSFVIQ